MKTMSRFIKTTASGRSAAKLDDFQRAKVICGRSAIVSIVVALLVVKPFFVSRVAAQEKTVDADKIERLEQLIKAQQQQLEYLQQQLNELKQVAAEAKIDCPWNLIERRD